MWFAGRVHVLYVWGPFFDPENYNKLINFQKIINILLETETV